jgi:hypothetical protein
MENSEESRYSQEFVDEVLMMYDEWKKRNSTAVPGNNRKYFENMRITDLTQKPQRNIAADDSTIASADKNQRLIRTPGADRATAYENYSPKITGKRGLPAEKQSAVPANNNQRIFGKPTTNSGKSAVNEPLKKPEENRVTNWGFGATAGPITIETNSESGFAKTDVGGNTNLGIGGGFKVCAPNPFEKQLKKYYGKEVPQFPFSVNAEINPAISLSTDNKRICADIGLSKNLFPVWLSKRLISF